MNNKGLKTLKDIKSDVPLSQIEDIDSMLLKKEAINWIKSISIGNFGMKGQFRDPTDEERRIVKESVVDWIKHFFNITPEDLKDE